MDERRCGRTLYLIRLVIVSVLVSLTSGLALAADPRPRSILILDQSDISGPLFHQILSGLLSTFNSAPGTPITVYVESLDLNRFTGRDYEQSALQHLQVKYRDKPIGVVMPVGDSSLALVLRWRAALWPDVPVAFSQVDEPTITQLRPPPDVTGVIMKLRLTDMVTAARAVVPDLARVVLVGDAWESQSVYRPWKDEIPEATKGLEVVDFTGLPMRQLRDKVSVLPDHTAILYSAIYSDGEGTSYPPVKALDLLAETADQPIVISVETFLGHGGIGGFVMVPTMIGESAARLALRILGGESVTSIPPAPGNIVRPIFDWRQMQRWDVSASSLPPGSEIRFREPTAWQQYSAQILLICAALLVQSALIFLLIYEHRRRRLAEIQSRNSMAELTQLNRLATAGELSATIAHEVNQPLAGMVTSADAALRWLSRENPDVGEARDALQNIVAAGHRASDVITSVRAMFRRDTEKKGPTDINKLVRTVLGLVYIDLRKHSIEAQVNLSDQLPPVLGNEVQLQQVILNLMMNAIDAMGSSELRVLSIKSETTGKDAVHVSIADTGGGIDIANLNRIFKPMFTTKARGMGMGLSICKSIIENHGGRIWVSANVPRGSVFQFELPVYRARKDKSGSSDRAVPDGTASTAASSPSPAGEMIE
jgi:signal transduction histidine kinase